MANLSFETGEGRLNDDGGEDDFVFVVVVTIEVLTTGFRSGIRTVVVAGGVPIGVGGIYHDCE